MKPGIYTMPEETYRNDPCETPSLSASVAKILCAQSPLHAWAAHPRLNPDFVREEKEIFDLGSVAHALMLQGLEVAVVLDYPDWRGKEQRLLRDAARDVGRIPILTKQWDRIQAMVNAGKAQLAAHKEASDAFANGKPEQTLIWQEDCGIWCRARLDWLHDSLTKFSDYKSTGMTANPEAMSRSMFGAGWDVQEAFYRRGLMKLAGKEATGTFICQEDSAPYALSAIGFNPLIMRVGDGKVQRAMDTWAQCLAENRWPGYPDRICFPVMPKWMEEMEMEKEVAHAL